ncbi:MAG: bifunctional tetrahydrofolate synthase/dihydrofolate synthase [Pseudomonadota bacterium]
MQPEPQADWSLQDWLSYQEQLHPSPIELGLARVRRVAEALGLLQTPPLTLTIGGTNGKGSSTTLLALIYREAGYQVGAFTSPHLYRYNERIAINGEPVDDLALCRAFSAIEQARAGDSLTYFEFGTLAALWLFREARVDVQVLEVGLGGRLDAVNILDADAALVTNIGLDHQDWLGEGRDAIGREKAGIFRAGRIAVIADRDPPDGLLQAAAQSQATVSRFDRGDYRHRREGQGWRWQGLGIDSPSLPLPALVGPHQLDNAAAAITLTQALQLRLPVQWPAIQRALSALQVPGRMERRGRFWFDVAHNAEAASTLAATLREQLGSQRVLWIAGVLADKPIAAIAAALAPVVERVITCDLSGPRSLGAAVLASRLQAAGLEAQAGGSPEAAFALALRQAAADQPILVCGSFLTVAAIAPLIAND